MKSMKSRNRTFLLFAASAALLLASTVGSTRAALSYRSENYEMKFDVSSIGVTLLENGEAVSRRDYVENRWEEESGELLTDMLGEDEALVPGRSYEERLSVRNSGSIDSYVRVTLYRSWTKDGKVMDTELSPELIGLELPGGDWIEDPSASTRERTVLYYRNILPSGQETPPFCTALRIDPAIGRKVSETREETPEGTVITTSFAYDGYQFHLKAEVNAVQTHSPEEAVKSAWGVDVEAAEDGSLSLKTAPAAP